MIKVEENSPCEDAEGRRMKIKNTCARQTNTKKKKKKKKDNIKRPPMN